MGKGTGVPRAALVLGLAAASLAYRRTKARRPARLSSLPSPPHGFVTSWRQEALRLRTYNDLLYDRAVGLIEENARLRADLESSRRRNRPEPPLDRRTENL